MDKLIFPNTRHQRIYDLLFLALLGLVIAIKFADLSLPFFWDEMGVYGHGVAYQYEHGISLMPNSLPDWISRGHPLMFTVINALCWKFFGYSLFKAHSFMLLVSLLLLTAVYRKLSRYTNQLTGLVAVTFLGMQPLFLAQSCMVLPEIMLSLFAFLGLASYYEKKYLQFAFWGSLAVLTKESAIVLPAACIAFSMLQSIMYGRLAYGLSIKALIPTLLPYVVFVAFLLLQKEQNGWYFFPYHLDSIKMDINTFIAQFSFYFDRVFWLQGRYWSEKLLLISLPICLLTKKLNYANFGKNFLTLLGIFMFFFLCISSLSSFYGDRYIMAVLMGAGILMGAALNATVNDKYAVFSITLFLCLVAYNHWESPTFEYDTDLGYRKSVQNLKDAIDYAKITAGDSVEIKGGWPAFFAVQFPEAGYFDPHKIKMGKPSVNSSPTTFYIISNPGHYKLPNLTGGKAELLQKFNNGYAVSEVYRIQGGANSNF